MSAALAAVNTPVADVFASRRLVVKIGSSLLVDNEANAARRQWLRALAKDLNGLAAQGTEIIIVSSGAIALGRRRLDFNRHPLSLPELQAAAAAGMIVLAEAYQEILGEFGMTVAQVLLTLDDTEDRRRYINARNTLLTLVRARAVPLINENDTVATDEIRFGDNDRLAARVAAMVSADTLVLLSDVDGLYTADPSVDPGARLVPVVHEITSEIQRMAGQARPGVGTGGMVTKLAAARIALGAGCRMLITDGRAEHPLKRVAAGQACTWFMPSKTPQAARKQWIAGSLKPAGVVTVDEGAVAALLKGKSLLPAGIVNVEGDFGRGAAVLIQSPDGQILGRGLAAYTAEESRRIIGHKTNEIEERLGYRGRDELIHRDDLALEREQKT